MVEDLVDTLQQEKSVLFEFIEKYHPKVSLTVNVESEGKSEHEIFNGYNAISGFSFESYVLKFLAEAGAQLDINIDGKFDFFN